MVRILLALAVRAGEGGVALAHDRENAEAEGLVGLFANPPSAPELR
jgi:hypothetical protein